MEIKRSGSHTAPTVAAQPLSCVALDAHGVRGHDAFEQWHEACRPVFEVEPLGPLRSFKAAFEFYEVDGLVFNRTQYAAASYHRTPSHVKGAGSEFFTLQLLLRGREVGESNGDPLLMAPDRIVLRDWSRPHHSFSEAAEQVSVIIPRDRIAARDLLHDREPAASWIVQSPQGMMLANALMSIWRSLPSASASDAPSISSGLLGLINGLLFPDPAPAESRRMQQANLAAMKSFLRQRLWDVDLGVDHLVRAFHHSRPTIYRMFGDSGGVRAFIQEQRLAAILQELKQRENPSLSLTQVAHRWGFRDAAYFHRAFKKRFGLTPGEVALRASEPKLPETNASLLALDTPTATLHQWLGTSR